MRGLTLGGDDYLVKPFSLEELVARVNAVLRRAGLAQPERGCTARDLEMDDDAHRVLRGGSEVRCRRPSTTCCATCSSTRDGLSKAQILDHVWQYDFGGDGGVVETYIGYLRRKVDNVEPAPHPHDPRRRLHVAGELTSITMSLRARAARRDGGGRRRPRRGRGGRSRGAPSPTWSIRSTIACTRPDPRRGFEHGGRPGGAPGGPGQHVLLQRRATARSTATSGGDARSRRHCACPANDIANHAGRARDFSREPFTVGTDPAFGHPVPRTSHP